MHLAITIDTEEDNWGEYDRASYTVENIARIPRLQEVFERRGVRPTYLISYPVATSPKAIDILGSLRERGVCEIGAHPHPWNTPPVVEERTPFHSFMSNLPAGLQFEKLRTLTETIERNYGCRPSVHRSGRWGFNDDVARNLIGLGYAVDTSVYPTCDWSDAGGPDYTARTHEPFVHRAQFADGRGGSLLEVPATLDFIQRPRRLASSVSRAVRRLPMGHHMIGVLSKLRLLNHLALSPEICDAAGMIRLADTLLHRGARALNLFFHSPTLLEGCSPYTRTPADVTSFIGRIDAFLSFAQRAGLRSVTMAELTSVMGDASSALPVVRVSSTVEVNS